MGTTTRDDYPARPVRPRTGRRLSTSLSRSASPHAVHGVCCDIEGGFAPSARRLPCGNRQDFPFGMVSTPLRELAVEPVLVPGTLSPFSVGRHLLLCCGVPV